jgi:signal transduction histidine kinase
MSVTDQQLAGRCESSLRDYLGGGGEPALHAAYQMARNALERGMGVLDLTALVYGALARVASEPGVSTATPAEFARLEPFLLECYSPFEMAHRGASEANAALRGVNDTLEQEIARLAHELHDEAGQMLAAVHLALEDAAAHVAPAGHERMELVRVRLREVETQLRRISHELRPSMLDDLGLLPALRFLGDGVAARTGVRVRVEGAVEERLPPAVETALYRAAQEALTNISRHARASHVAVAVERRPGEIVLRVADDGVGFDVRAAGRAGSPRGMGLSGIRGRVAPLGGTLEIRSAPGTGTEIGVSIPVGDHAHAAYPAG